MSHPTVVDERGRGHRVLLVREWDQVTTGSNCCGRLGGGDEEIADAADFSHSRMMMERVGGIHRALRAELPGLDLQVVDPRNTVYLIPTVLRDARRRRGDGWRRAAREAARATSRGAIVVDGRVIGRGEVPDPDDAVGRVLRALCP